ncbi:MAG: hypothetical protein IJ608_03160 [Lachnospiraceae bacterium]|nr:hypothetical protein [Lachnospiraceae bacterium]
MFQPFFYVTGIALSVLMSGEGRVIRSSLFTMAGGLVNVLLDYIFLKHLRMGISGAALATLIGTVLTFLLFFIHYLPLWKDRRCLRLRPVRHFSSIGRICANGSSEMVSTLALSISVLLMNRLMARIGGEDGISALLIVSYASEFFLTVFNGLNVVVEPLFSFHYGKGDKRAIRRLYKQSFVWTLLNAFAGILLLWICREPYVDVFFDRGSELYELGLRALVLSLAGIALQGVNVYIQCLFTAFSDALVSGVLSALNTFVFMIGAELVMAYWCGESGLFAAQSVAEAATLFFSAYCLWRFRGKYGYGG